MTDRLRETDALPLSDDELAFVRRHEATVCCCEKTLLSTPDAQVWAKEFCETFGGNTVNGGVVDLELMFGWFANAMEAGRMQVSSATPSPQDTAESFEGYLCRRLGDNYSAIVIAALDALRDENADDETLSALATLSPITTDDAKREAMTTEEIIAFTESDDR